MNQMSQMSLYFCFQLQQINQSKTKIVLVDYKSTITQIVKERRGHQKL